eukprot:scaffold636_cov252-Pinguiococcus_pyrenoidosus.AAC.1
MRLAVASAWRRGGAAPGVLLDASDSTPHTTTDATQFGLLSPLAERVSARAARDDVDAAPGCLAPTVAGCVPLRPFHAGCAPLCPDADVDKSGPEPRAGCELRPVGVDVPVAFGGCGVDFDALARRFEYVLRSVGAESVSLSPRVGVAAGVALWRAAQSAVLVLRRHAEVSLLAGGARGGQRVALAPCVVERWPATGPHPASLSAAAAVGVDKLSCGRAALETPLGCALRLESAGVASASCKSFATRTTVCANGDVGVSSPTPLLLERQSEYFGGFGCCAAALDAQLLDDVEVEAGSCFGEEALVVLRCGSSALGCSFIRLLQAFVAMRAQLEQLQISGIGASQVKGRIEMDAAAVASAQHVHPRGVAKAFGLLVLPIHRDASGHVA